MSMCPIDDIFVGRKGKILRGERIRISLFNRDDWSLRYVDEQSGSLEAEDVALAWWWLSAPETSRIRCEVGIASLHANHFLTPSSRMKYRGRCSVDEDINGGVSTIRESAKLYLEYHHFSSLRSFQASPSLPRNHLRTSQSTSNLEFLLTTRIGA